MSIVLLLKISRRGGEIGETDDDTQSGSATDIIGTSEVRWIIQSFMIDPSLIKRYLVDLGVLTRKNIWSF